MSNFDQQEFEHLKKLCRIECSSEEEAEILDSLQRVLDYVELLNEVDTEHVEPCQYVLRSILKNQMREDEVKDLLSRELFMSNVPEHVGGMVRVLPVMKNQ